MAAIIGRDIEAAARWLQREDLVAIPTETVYGLAGNAYSDRAVSRIFEVKNRPRFDPIIVHARAPESLDEIVADMPALARRLAEAFMPGPLTLLLPRSGRVPDLVTAGSPLVAVRVPNHRLTLQLLERLPFPLAAPSANPFGYISPTTASHVARQLGDRIPYILDGGPCTVGVESTIVGFPEGHPTLFRKGGVAQEDIEALIGPIEVRPHSTSRPEAPGMLASHYAPRAPLVLGPLDDLRARYAGHRLGLISFRRRFRDHPAEWQVTLAPSGDLREAARRLFSALRQLDEQSLDLILAEPVPEEGLGRAINDRLRRAAAPR
jgi:L-threonylcarbamoyladenylate synthase